MKKLISIELFDDGGTLRANCSTERGDPGLILDQLIRKVAELRATVQPPVEQTDPDPAHPPLLQADDPRWHLALDASHAAVLSVRHPGLGWIAFRLPDESKDRLRRLLA